MRAIASHARAPRLAGSVKHGHGAAGESATGSSVKVTRPEAALPFTGPRRGCPLGVFSATVSGAATFENPILNSPYDPPAEHFVIGPRGPTGETRPGRRPSESFVPIPTGRRAARAKRGTADAGSEELTFDLDVTGERREQN